MSTTAIRDPPTTMTPVHPLNIYAGPNALQDYYDPDKQPLLPLVEIPECLNPFREDNVRIYAKMMTMLPAHNVKALPGFSEVLHNQDRVTHVGGIQIARKDAEDNGEIANPNRYENDANWESHYRWTGPQITKQLPDVNIICAGMGTSGTMTGVGTFFKENKPSVKLVACCTAPGQRVPGPRSQALLGPVDFPWRDAVDQIEEVGEVDSYSLSMKLSREGLICGPSSGFNLKGLCQMLERRKNLGTLDSLPNSDGFIHCVFICCDLPYQYVDEYFSKLDEASFPPVHNSNLTKVDLYRYDEAWELEATDALTRIYGLSSGPVQGDDFPRALDALFRGLTPPASFEEHSVLVDLRTDSPFKDAATLEKQWLELDALFRVDSGRVEELREKHVLALCYDGDTSRVATSVLRANGVDACSLRGGLRPLLKRWAAMAEKKSEGTPAAADSKTDATPYADMYGAATDASGKPELVRPVVA